MIQTIRKKLKSEDGASLMLALLFFVICAMVASVILAAATASAGRISKLEKADRNRYALESAAGVLKEELAGLKYISTQELNDEGEPDDESELSVSWEKRDKEDNTYKPVEEIEVKFSEVLKALVTGTGESLHEYTISLENAENRKKVPDVIMVPSRINTTEDKYSLKIVLSIAGKASPTMTLTLPADYQKHDETKDGTTSHIEEITWHTCVAVLNDGEFRDD